MTLPFTYEDITIPINFDYFCFSYDGNKRVLSALRKSGHLVVDGKVEKIPYLDQSRIPSQ